MDKYEIIPSIAFLGFILFGLSFMLSASSYIFGRMGYPVGPPLELSFFVMIGSFGMVIVSIVAFIEAVCLLYNKKEDHEMAEIIKNIKPFPMLVKNENTGSKKFDVEKYIKNYRRIS